MVLIQFCIQHLQADTKDFSFTESKFQVHSNFLHISIKSELGWASIIYLYEDPLVVSAVLQRRHLCSPGQLN